MFDIDKFIEERKREEEIHCPHCDKPFDFSEEVFDIDQGLITYWGGEDIIKVECTYCDKIFHILEIVRRTFRVNKTGLGL